MPKKKITILIADDHALLRRGVRNLLEQNPDWEVCGEASTGQEAIEKAKELQPNVVVMDVSMPILNGIEATAQIREVLPQTEVLIISMHDSREMISAAAQVGARGYFVKSNSDNQLLEAIRTVCRHEPFFPEVEGIGPTKDHPPSRDGFR